MSGPTKKITRTAGLALAAILPLTACGGGSEGADSAESTVQVLTFASQEQMQPVVDAFTAANPELTVEIQTVPFDDLNSVIQSRVGGKDEEVDVYMVDQPRVAALADQGMLLDITDRVAIPDGGEGQ